MSDKGIFSSKVEKLVQASMWQCRSQTVFRTYETNAPPISGLATAVTAQIAQEAIMYFLTSFGGSISLNIICTDIRSGTRFDGDSGQIGLANSPRTVHRRRQHQHPQQGVKRSGAQPSWMRRYKCLRC